jgi:hypothetical protein
MAYDTNSLNVSSPRLGEGENLANAGFSSAMWCYRSADPILTVIAAGYINDGNDKGLRVNDCVIVIDDNVPTIDVCLVTAIAANGDVTLLNGT